MEKSIWRMHANHVENSIWRHDVKHVENAMPSMRSIAYGDMMSSIRTHALKPCGE